MQRMDPNLTYLSIYAPVDEAGVTLDQHVTEIRASLSQSLKSSFDEKLSFYEVGLCTRRFDYQTAVKSFRFILSADVPMPNSDDPRILDLRWKCNFGSLPNTGDPDTWL